MTELATPLRLGLIGFGAAARTFHVPFITATPGLTLAAVASSREDLVHTELPAVAVHSSAATLIADASLDVVVIATPPDSHAALAIAALEAEHHVVVEKPFALSLASAREVARTAHRVGRTATVFQNRRQDSCFLSVRAALSRGDLGRVTHFESRFDRYRPDVRVRWKEAGGPGSGLWQDLGPHLVDQALLLFGKPEAVTAAFARHREDAMAPDWVHVGLHYPGLEALLHASVLVCGGSPRFTIHGTEGSLQKQQGDPQEKQLQTGLSPTAAEFGVDHDPVHLWDRKGNLRLQPAERGLQASFYAALRDSIQRDLDPPVTMSEAIATLEVLDAAERSARDRRTVFL